MITKYYAGKDINLNNLKLKKGDEIPPSWCRGDARNQLMTLCGNNAITTMPNNDVVAAIARIEVLEKDVALLKKKKK